MAWTALASAGQGPILPLRFVAEVARGQAFEKEIGGGLVFRLVPDQHGWTILVGPRTTSDADFVAVVTPPFRGVNPRFIEGWHFRNADNSGPNAPGPTSVNAPQALREFAFVTSERDHRTARETLEKLLWPSSAAARERAERFFESVEARAARGRLTILDLRLGNLGAGQRAWIDWMRFEVELVRP